MIAGTAQAWLEALTTNRGWDQARDQRRFEVAFATLARTAKRWPTVAELLEAMPRPPEQARLLRPTCIPGTREARCEHLQHLLGAAYNPAVADPDYEPAKATAGLSTPEERRAAEAALALRHSPDQEPPL